MNSAVPTTAPGEISDSTLLCETCGYVIEGLPDISHCPECGRPVESSLPKHRTGSPIQQAATGNAYIATNLAMLRTPAAIFDRLRTTRGGPLMAFNVLIAVLLLVPVISLIPFPTLRTPLGSFHIPNYVPAALSAAVAFYFLTFVEHAGIRFYSRRRGWRIPRGLAWEICLHASIGWILASFLCIVGLAITFLLGKRIADGVVWVLNAFGDKSTAPETIITWIGIAFGFGGALAGLLWFESLVYLGVRRCKFANRA